MPVASIRSAEEFLSTYGAASFPVDDVAQAFDSLRAQERYLVLVKLRTNPFSHEPLLRSLLPEPIWNLPLRWLCENQATVSMREMISLTQQAIQETSDLWEKRFQVEAMLYQLQSWQWELQAKYVENPENHAFEESRAFLTSALQVFYLETADPFTGGNPLFDTDHDGVFDDEDAYPLDPQFSSDIDKDRMPDQLDPATEDPAVSFLMNDGETRELRSPSGQSLLRFSRKEGDTMITVPLTFQFPDEETEATFNARWPEAKEAAEQYLNERMPSGISFRVVEEPKSGQLVAILPGDKRGSSSTWYLSFLENDKTHMLAHELMHFLLRWRQGSADLYQEDDIFGKDHLFEPGWSFLHEESDIMNNPLDSTIPDEDILIPIGLGLSPENDPRVLALYQAEVFKDNSVTFSLLGDNSEDPNRAKVFYRKMEKAAQKAKRLSQNDVHTYYLLAASQAQAASLTENHSVRRKHLQEMLANASRAVQVSPQSERGWIILAAALDNEAHQVDGDQKSELQKQALKAAERAVMLSPSSYEAWYQLANICANLGGEWIGSDSWRDYYFDRAEEACRISTKLAPSSFKEADYLHGSIIGFRYRLRKRF